LGFFSVIAWQAAPGWLAARRRIYAIADVHGCAEKLRALHRRIQADLAARPGVLPLLIHLGDVIDRGPDTAGVLDILAGKLPAPTINLRGNHEATLAAALTGDAAAATDWLVGGGRESLASWGADPGAPEGWAAAIPPAHRAVLDRMELYYDESGYVFVHAGIRPGVALREQTEADLVGIRHPFLTSEADHGFIVVHGHTPRFAPELRDNRIGIDTAAVFGGKLTCLVLEEDRMGFLQA
jgi:serine/threonine protein phosphatase 1